MSAVTSAGTCASFLHVLVCLDLGRCSCCVCVLHISSSNRICAGVGGNSRYFSVSRVGAFRHYGLSIISDFAKSRFNYDPCVMCQTLKTFSYEIVHDGVILYICRCAITLIAT